MVEPRAWLVCAIKRQHWHGWGHPQAVIASGEGSRCRPLQATTDVAHADGILSLLIHSFGELAGGQAALHGWVGLAISQEYGASAECNL